MTVRNTVGETVCAAIRKEGSQSPWQVFATLPTEDFQGMKSFRILGYEGVVLSYSGEVAPLEIGVLHDYYVFEKDGTPCKLLAVRGSFGEPYALDLMTRVGLTDWLPSEATGQNG